MDMAFQPPLTTAPDKLPLKQMTELGQLSPARFSLALGFDLAVIVGAIAVSEFYFFNPLAYVATVILIGSRLHAMGILMHDCVHYRAFKSRKVNMTVAELIAWVLTTTGEGYRSNHLTHHKHLNTMQDPDWVRKLPQSKFHFPKTKRMVLKDLFYQMSGLGTIELARSLSQSVEVNQVSTRTRHLRLAFYAAVLLLCGIAGTLDKLALYWLVPMLTTFPVLFYMRSVAEHHGNLAYDHTYTNSRTTIPSAWERFLFMPHNVGYHLEHHLYPHVPFYRLQALHQALMEREQYACRAHLTRGVCSGLLKEWIGPARGPHIRNFAANERAAGAAPAA